TLLREGLRIRALAPQLVPNRRRIFPEDDWTIGATRSLLGVSLTALARYGEAETVLLEARRDASAALAVFVGRRFHRIFHVHAQRRPKRTERLLEQRPHVTHVQP